MLGWHLPLLQPEGPAQRHQRRARRRPLRISTDSRRLHGAGGWTTAVRRKVRGARSRRGARRCCTGGGRRAREDHGGEGAWAMAGMRGSAMAAGWCRARRLSRCSVTFPRAAGGVSQHHVRPPLHLDSWAPPALHAQPGTASKGRAREASKRRSEASRPRSSRSSSDQLRQPPARSIARLELHPPRRLRIPRLSSLPPHCL